MIFRCVIFLTGLMAVIAPVPAADNVQRDDPAALNDPLAQLVVDLHVTNDTNFPGTSSSPGPRVPSFNPPAAEDRISTTAESGANHLERFRRANDTNAISGLQAHLATHPRDAAAWQLLGDLNLRGRNNRAAENALQRAFELAPADTGIVNSYATALARNGKPDKAIELLRDALLLEPDYHAARFNLAGIAAKNGRYDEALKHLQLLETRRWDGLRLHIPDSDLDSLRDLPAFVALQQRVSAASRGTENKP